MYMPSAEDTDIRTVTATAPACFGVLCPFHRNCARYAAVALSQADPDTLLTCAEGEHFPLFVPLEARQTSNS
jgi:hypothetical protein